MTKTLKTLIALVASAFAVSACTEKIDTLQQQLDTISQRTSALEVRLVKLEVSMAVANNDIAALQALCESMQKNYGISEVKALYNGYEIVFTNGESIQISNGAKGDKGDKGDQGEKGEKGDPGEDGEKGDTGAQGETGPQGPQGEKGDTGDTGGQGPKGDKGEDGEDGYVPVISIQYDSASGRYVWIVDGEVFRDSKGNPYYASGLDAVTPQVKTGSQIGSAYVADAVYVSVDGGSTWTRISGEDGVSFFTSVTVDEYAGKVHFVMFDGTELEVPFVKDFELAFSLDSLSLAYGRSSTVAVSAKGVVSSQLVKPDGWRVSLSGSVLTVTAPAAGNLYAEDAGDVALIAVSKGGFSQICKLSVSVLPAALELTPAPAVGAVTIVCSPNAAVSSYRLGNVVLSDSQNAAMDDAAALAHLAAHGEEMSSEAERALTVGESFYLGTAWVLASYTDQRDVTTLVRIPFEVQRPHVALSLNSRSGGDASWHVLPNSHTSFYFEWIGKSSVLAAYGGDPAEDIDAFASYLGARPVGTVTTIWNRYERDLGASGLEDGTPYSVIIIPVSSSNGLTHTGMFSRLDF